MRLSFIGMSNIGKSSWAKRLAGALGIAHLNCDALIGARLGADLHRSALNVRELAAWMGLPSSASYEERSRQYLACEQEVMTGLLDQLAAEPATENILDTTGSVIYTGKTILDKLRRQTRVVYFEASEEHIEGLFRSYIANPKPVIWQDHYLPLPNETMAQTLTRCYPKLLIDRAERYRTLADLTIPFDVHRDPSANLMTYILRHDRP